MSHTMHTKTRTQSVKASSIKAGYLIRTKQGDRVVKNIVNIWAGCSQGARLLFQFVADPVPMTVTPDQMIELVLIDRIHA